MNDIQEVLEEGNIKKEEILRNSKVWKLKVNGWL